MDKKQTLDKWSEQLLDTGKRSNLINFRDTKYNSFEIVLPDSNSIFERIGGTTKLEVFDPLLDDDDDFIDDIEDNKQDELSKEEYISKYKSKIKKKSQVLLFNSKVNPVKVLRSIDKKTKSAIDETGVNILYMAFGFINWSESENSNIYYKAPILLSPISFENKSRVEPIYINMVDDDIIVNPTFVYKLKNEYGIELPEYNDEDLEEYLGKVQNLVSRLKWKVINECKVSTFSFLKINMYMDLKDNFKVIFKNANIKALAGESVANEEPLEKKQEILFNDLHNVIDADSSQQEAIEMAKRGKSFVLQGPPGTGKSQTITNIIAECLNDGKKVLFVSEKLAALNVVYQKLKDEELDDFCLELHSYKANKKNFISELCRTLKLPKSDVSSRAQGEIEQKENAQKQLDEYAKELHIVYPKVNKSLYQIYQELAKVRKTADADYLITNIEEKDEKYFVLANDLLGQYTTYVSSIGYDYRNSIWYGYKHKDTSYEEGIKLRNHLNEFLSMCDKLGDLNDELSSRLDIDNDSLFSFSLTKDLLNVVKDSNFVTSQLLKKPVKESLDIVEELKVLSKTILDRKASILANFDKDIFKLDGNDIYKKLTKQFDGLFSRLFSGEYKKIITDIKMCSLDNKKPKYEDAVESIKILSEYQSYLVEFNTLESKIKNKLANGYVGVETDFTKLVSELTVICNAEQNVDLNGFASLSSEEYENKKSDFADLSDKYNKCFNKYLVSLDYIVDCFNKDKFDILNSKFEIVKDRIERCFNKVDTLPNWVNFTLLLEKLSKNELLEFVHYTIKNDFSSEEIGNIYNKIYYKQWAECIIYKSKYLTTLTRIPHDKLVETFAEKDKLQFEINKAKIKAKLSNNRPELNMVAQGSAISVLLREGEKKRKQKGIRKLISEVGDLIQVIKPCFLMSPLSVSTFLPSSISFDVVIFDEASQIFPQDAIGAIYRGKQLIVVGDSKQMPPSNFFNTSYEGEDDDEDENISDFESILDLCSTSLPQIRLKWHYRSRYEQLIAFSNKNFYDNDLISFPSSKTKKEGNGVDYYFVNGKFDRKSHNNLKEAEAVVDLVFKHIEDTPNRSLGVVAFSISQQELIERVLAKRLKEDKTKEIFFASDKTEKFFIKNLETVQGDERDTIIFSIGYGPDSEGKVLHNFGPINRVGGERRLNVAVTRAKLNVKVVASMHYTDIDLNRVHKEGGRLLREYLDYAENGDIALQRSLKVNSFEEYDSEFELEVCEFLRNNGLKVDTQVGCSSFRIDLALKNGETSNYVLAIECDGATYHSSKTARDRDRLRQEILERMGWKFYRIWSTDWFKNKATEQQRLLEAANEALKNPQVKKVDKKPEELPSFDTEKEAQHLKFPKYKEADLLNIYKTYYKNGYSKNDNINFQLMLREILKVEAPISEEWLLKRLAYPIFDREKVTSVVRREYQELMAGYQRNGIIIKDGFLYIEGEKKYVLRVPSNTCKREIKYIAPEELAAGIKIILRQNVNAEKEGLFKAVVEQLGFSRVSDSTHEQLDKALNILRGLINKDGDMLSLK